MHSTLPDPDRQPEFYASVPAKRLMAWLIDVVLVGILTFVICMMTFGLLLLVFPIVFVAVDFTYRWMCLSLSSATLGMRLMVVEIRNGAGQRLSSSEAAAHTFFYMLCAAFVLPWILSVLMMVFGPRRQGLHDVLLGTGAMNRPG